MRVGASVTPSIGSTSIARHGVALAQALQRGGRVAVDRDAEALEQRARPVGDVEAPAGGRAIALQQRRHLQQRVVADLRDRGVPGDAVGASA